MITLPAVTLLFAGALAGRSTPAPTRLFHFAHEAVLGTSVDFIVAARDEATALRADSAMRREIGRLERTLSSYDPGSELSRLVAAGRLRHPSPALLEVLRQYDAWHRRSGGAYSARIAPLTALWRDAETTGRLPAPDALAAAARHAGDTAWQYDAGADELRVPRGERLDLSSLGKGYILDHALAVARGAAQGSEGMLLDIGGDIGTWGRAPGGRDWRIGVIDPIAPADNAPPRALLGASIRAVSSSGGYARGFTIGGRHYSHIIDPRTGRPADGVAGATVTAADNATANALATTLTILPVAEGLRLVDSTPGAEALIIDAAGREYRSAGFRAHELAPPPAATAAPAITATLVIDITPAERNRHRPYVAVWVTDTAGKLLRTIAYWGNKPKYTRELSKWYGLVRATPDLIDAVTRATRSAGSYTLTWDGLTDSGTALPAGAYTFWLEAALEDGPHSLRSVTVACGATAGRGVFEAAPAFAGGTVTCAAAPAR